MTTDRDLLAEARAVDVALTPAPWFSVVNDLVGGRSVQTVDTPTSQSMTNPPAWVVDMVFRDDDAGHIAWMRNNWGEILRRWESDGRDLRAHAAVLEAVMAELGIADGNDEEILPRIQTLVAARARVERVAALVYHCVSGTVPVARLRDAIEGEMR